MVPRKGIPQGLCVSSQGSRRSQGVWEKWQRLVSALEIRALQQRGRCWAGKGEQRSLWERFGVLGKNLGLPWRHQEANFQGTDSEGGGSDNSATPSTYGVGGPPL